jgi:hypothetical protein
MKTLSSYIVPRVIALVFVCCFVAHVGCSGESSLPVTSEDPNPSVTPPAPAKDLGELNSTEKLLYTQSYAGWLVVHFDETLKLRLNESNQFYSKAGAGDEATAVNSVLAEYPDAWAKRSVDTSEEQVDTRRMELEWLSGTDLADWNSIYHIEISDPDDAVLLIRGLGALESVQNVYPSMLIQDMNLTTTPDLTVHQGYLADMNVNYAWTQGITGQDVTLVDGEAGWNKDHLDLPISDPSAQLGVGGCFVGDTNPICASSVPHGTAVVGIMGAIDNGHGTTGIAHGANIKFVNAAAAGPAGVLNGLTDGNPVNGELDPGDVIGFPIGFAGKLTPNGQCGQDVASQYGCMPVDISQDVFVAVQQAVAAGITVVEGAANGSISLDDPTVYRTTDVDLSIYDSGSIIAGASQGSNHQKAAWSNCGSAVTTYAWGQDVATSAYPYGLYAWNGTTPPLPPNSDDDAFFVDMFAGTSAATPMIASAAALIQSYAKQLMGDKRHLMPLKIREIIENTGLPQSGGGCNIGAQPRLDQAFAMVSSLWSSWSSAYPELTNNQVLNQTEILDLRADGLGIVCVEGDPANSDPTCPDDSMWIPGTGIAEDLDFDGDGRADLVSWKAGQFTIDLSSAGSTDDGFGNWDTVISYPEISNNVVWPYIEDMNSDGREDLVLYNKTNGTWYIKYTTSMLLGGAGFSGWDHVITTNVQDQLMMDPWQTMYCRPHPGDYNGDGWVDLAVACSDGVWYIAHRSGNWPSSVTYNEQVTYLTSQQLSDAPGWAYLTTTGDYSDDDMNDIIIKVPDTLQDAGRVIFKGAPSFSGDPFGSVPHIFGGNESVMLLGAYTQESGWISVGVKSNSGDWLVADAWPDSYSQLNSPYPSSVYGGLDCHPIAADFDGDGLDDRAVMCPGSWKIAYSSNVYSALMIGGMREVGLGYDSTEFTLPGRSYAGGISYEKALELLDFLQGLNPNQPPPIPVDMVSLGTCQLVGGGDCQ